MPAENDSREGTIELAHQISSLREIIQIPFTNWFEVGIALNITENDLNSIKISNREDENACRKYTLSKWFEKNEQVTYEKLINALYSTGNKAQAMQIRREKGKLITLYLHTCKYNTIGLAKFNPETRLWDQYMYTAWRVMFCILSQHYQKKW